MSDSSATERPSHGPAGTARERIYAITDVHGRYDLLLPLLDQIETREPDGATVVFLGDYIDRGPHSREVIELLMAGPRRDGDEWIILKGNHEAMMVDTHREPLNQAWWCGNGGAACLASFGGSVPEHVLAWCEALPVKYETENHFFVHAGVNPLRVLSKQEPEEMLWIRDKFLMSKMDFGKHIVHGHTPFDQPELMGNRTNLDTGAFYTGRLTAGVFDRSRSGGPVLLIESRTPAEIPEGAKATERR